MGRKHTKNYLAVLIGLQLTVTTQVYAEEAILIEDFDGTPSYTVSSHIEGVRL